MVKKTLVLLCFRLKMLIVDRFYCVFAQKTLQSVAKNRFCGYELAKPFVLPLQFFGNVYFPAYFFQTLCFKAF